MLGMGDGIGNRRRPLWVIFDRDEAGSKSRYVGCGPESGSKTRVLSSVAMGLCVLMVSPGA